LFWHPNYCFFLSLLNKLKKDWLSCWLEQQIVGICKENILNSLENFQDKRANWTKPLEAKMLKFGKRNFRKGQMSNLVRVLTIWIWIGKKDNENNHNNYNDPFLRFCEILKRTCSNSSQIFFLHNFQKC